MTLPIAEIERAAYAAWPAQETVAYDGWLLRSGNGFSRRINSVAAGDSTIPLDEKLAHCRTWYQERGLPLLFRITPATPPYLDGELAARHFRAEGETIVMTRSSLPVEAPPTEGRIDASPNERWIAAELDLAGVDRDQAGAWLAVLDRIPEPAGFALLMSSGVPVAAGIGVVVGNWLGVFEVVVESTLRRRGHGRSLMLALHSWAAARGARRAFLQVVG